MKTIVYLILVIIGFSCTKIKNKKNQNISFEEKSEIKLILKDTLNIFKFDEKINDLEFVNPESIINNVGTLKGRIIKGKDLPHVIFSNSEKTQELKAVLFPGSGNNDVYQFKVTYNNSNTESLKTSYNEFIAGSGVKLGITKNELVSIKGKGFEKDGNTLRYEIKEYENPIFFKKYNLPLYYETYIFDSDKLIQFEFGFIYP